MLKNDLIKLASEAMIRKLQQKKLEKGVDTTAFGESTQESLRDQIARSSMLLDREN